MRDLINKNYKSDSRTIKQIKEHYKVEKAIASKLKNANEAERKQLYPLVYDELFKSVPHHPQLKRKADPESQKKATKRQLELLNRYLTPKTNFLELGPGDCSLSFEIAKYVRNVYAIDVSKEITQHFKELSNFHLILSDGSSVNVPRETINIVYSNQLIEHLHPDDAIQQLKKVFRALVPGGIYICITPHRFQGPHDISKYFDKKATGLHLKEYTNKEIYNLFRLAGFKKIKTIKHIKGKNIILPIYHTIAIEYILCLLPHSIRRIISSKRPFSNFLGIRLIANKDA